MSEYQYYEWLAVDRSLTDREMSEVNQVLLLAGLRGLAEHQHRLPAFAARLAELAGRYARRSSLRDRMRRAGLV